MKLPAKVEYAIKAVLELSKVYQDKKPLKTSSITGKQNISSKFLLQIMIRLKNGGIVRSERGISGGYLLLKSPESISLKDVINAVDVNILSKESVKKKSGNKFDEVLFTIWNEASLNLEKYLENITFDILIKKIHDKEALFYTI
jgi:Rrf2 family transcriptional regulator, cysteine metabolism repressor